MNKLTYAELEALVQQLETKNHRYAQVEKELLEKQAILKEQNIHLVRKSIELSDIKRELEDKNHELETARHELKNQNISLTRKSIDLSDVMRQLEDKNYDLQLAQSDLKRILRALMESEDRYRRLVENSLVGIGIVQDHVLKFANQKLTEILGYQQSKEIVGQPIMKVVAPESRDRVADEINARESGHQETTHYEFKALQKNGSTIDVELFGSRIKYDGKDAAMGITIDISQRKQAAQERKKLEEQLRHAQKMEAIGTLAGGIAHDFNNILMAIMGYTEITYLKLPEDSKEKQNLKQVIVSANRAKDLVKQILAFSRKSGREMGAVAIETVIAEALKLLKSSIPTTIRIKSCISPDVKPIYGNSTQVHQIIMNLCTNAAHAMREKGGVLEINLEPCEFEAGEELYDGKGLAPGEYVRLTVSDTGHGMEPAVIRRIFEPYYTTKKVGEGTGMGLAVIHGIVKSYQGEVVVYSEPGNGTTFHIFFPVLHENKETSSVLARKSSIVGGHERILFVDDEKGLVEMAPLMLESLGYNVFATSSSLEALTSFRMKPTDFDLVITDQTMPHMTGVALTAAIRAVRPDIPVIICSGFSDSINDKNFKALGINAFIMKPFSKKEIAAAIREVLDSKEAQNN